MVDRVGNWCHCTALRHAAASVVRHVLSCAGPRSRCCWLTLAISQCCGHWGGEVTHVAAGIFSFMGTKESTWVQDTRTLPVLCRSWLLTHSRYFPMLRCCSCRHWLTHVLRCSLLLGNSAFMGIVESLEWAAQWIVEYFWFPNIGEVAKTQPITTPRLTFTLIDWLTLNFSFSVLVFVHLSNLPRILYIHSWSGTMITQYPTNDIAGLINVKRIMAVLCHPRAATCCWRESSGRDRCGHRNNGRCPQCDWSPPTSRISLNH